MFSGPNTCPPGTAVTAATAGLNVTGLPPNYCSNPTITTCPDATKPDINLDCTSCGLKTPAMESFCCSKSFLSIAQYYLLFPFFFSFLSFMFII